MVSCKKKTTIRVRVFNPALNEYVPNATVVLNEITDKTLFSSGGCKEIASEVTDNDGYALFDGEKLSTSSSSKYRCGIKDSWGIIPTNYESGFTKFLNAEEKFTPLLKASYQGVKNVAAGYADNRYDDNSSVLGSVLTNFAVGFGGEYLGNQYGKEVEPNKDVIKNMTHLNYALNKSGMALAGAAAGTFVSSFTEKIFKDPNGNYFNAFSNSFSGLQPWTSSDGQADLLSDGELILILTIVKPNKK